MLSKIFFCYFILFLSGCSQKQVPAKSAEANTNIATVKESGIIPLDSIIGEWKIVSFEENGQFHPLQNIVYVTIRKDFIIKKDTSLTETYFFTKSKNTITLYKGSEVSEVILLENYGNGKLILLSDYTRDRLRLLMTKD
jgi:hypothetical protein